MRSIDFTPEQQAALKTCYTITSIAKASGLSWPYLAKAIAQNRLKAVPFADTNYLVFADDLADFLKLHGHASKAA